MTSDIGIGTGFGLLLVFFPGGCSRPSMEKKRDKANANATLNSIFVIWGLIIFTKNYSPAGVSLIYGGKSSQDLTKLTGCCTRAAQRHKMLQVATTHCS